MRQYRGKCKDNGKWVKGWYCVVEDDHYIITDYASTFHVTSLSGQHVIEGFHEVIPETVGQSTGLKNTYAGDLIKIKDSDWTAIGIVVWDNETLQWQWKCCKEETNLTMHKGRLIPLWRILDTQSRFKGKVIGNIHDNKHLIDNSSEV